MINTKSGLDNVLSSVPADDLEKHLFITDLESFSNHVEKAGATTVLISGDGDFHSPKDIIDFVIRKILEGKSPSDRCFVMCCRSKEYNSTLTDFFSERFIGFRDGLTLISSSSLASLSDPDQVKKYVLFFLASKAGRQAERPLPTGILDNNLNEEVGYDRFFKSFGYEDDSVIFLRLLNDRKRGGYGENKKAALSAFETLLPYARQRNQEGWSPFFIVNGDGNEDKDVKHARAQFVDFDDCPFPEQIKRLNHFPLEPSAIIKTKKSLHCYWILKDGDIKHFRNIQERLIRYFGTDPSIINESRIMRLYGFNHCKQDPVLVKLIKFDPDLKYSQKQIAECLPEIMNKSTEKTIKKEAGELVPYGQRHYYVVSRIGYFVRKLGESATPEMIYNLIEADFLQHCEGAESEDLASFRKKYMKTIEKYLERDRCEREDPELYSYSMKAWNMENPGKIFDKNETSWEEVLEAGRRAKEAGRTFIEGEGLIVTLPEIDPDRIQGPSQQSPERKQETQSGKPKYSIQDILSAVENMEDVEEIEPEWIIYPYIPRGEVIILASKGGTGKGFIVSSILAGITNGKYPSIFGKGEGFDGEQEIVLYLTTEDDKSKVLKRRFRQAGVNMKNVKIISRRNPLIQDIKLSDENKILKTLIHELRPSLVIFDPLQSFLPDRVKMGERNQMRSCINNLSVVGAETNTSFLIFCHMNKRDTTDVQKAIADSNDIWDIARSVMVTGRTESEGVNFLSHEKSNYAVLGDTVLYQIAEPGRAVYAGTTKKRFEDFALESNANKYNAPKKLEAVEFIMNTLREREGNSMLVTELEEACVANKISRTTVRRAKESLRSEKKVVMWPVGYGKERKWYIGFEKPDQKEPEEDEHLNIHQLSLDDLSS